MGDYKRNCPPGICKVLSPQECICIEPESIQVAGLTRAVAISIANDLFVNGNGDEAIRLVLELRMKKDGGGWCKEAVIDLIERKLNASNRSAEPQSMKKSSTTEKAVGSSGGLGSPQRYKLSRQKGWKMPPNTVRVARPGRWGNPWRIGMDGTAAQCVEKHLKWIEGNMWSWPTKNDIQRELRGKNVACWCPLEGPCHGDTLLRLAN